MPLVIGKDVCRVVGGILMMLHRWIIVCISPIVVVVIIRVIHIVRVRKVMARVDFGLMRRRGSWYSRCSRDGTSCLCRNISGVGSGYLVIRGRKRNRRFTWFIQTSSCIGMIKRDLICLISMTRIRSRTDTSRGSSSTRQRYHLGISIHLFIADTTIAIIRCGDSTFFITRGARVDTLLNARVERF